jgi:DNA-binding MarR family transcriptional regulator
MKSYGKSNSLNLHLLIAMSRTTKKIHNRSASIFTAGGITTAQFSVLDVLYHKGSQSIRQITQLVLSTGGNMTVVINNMEKHGWISRCVHPDDKRCTVISISEEGKHIFEAIFPEHLKDLGICFSMLTNEEKTTLITLLKKVGLEK